MFGHIHVQTSRMMRAETMQLAACFKYAAAAAAAVYGCKLMQTSVNFLKPIYNLSLYKLMRVFKLM